MALIISFELLSLMNLPTRNLFNFKIIIPENVTFSFVSHLGIALTHVFLSAFELTRVTDKKTLPDPKSDLCPILSCDFIFYYFLFAGLNK